MIWIRLLTGNLVKHKLATTLLFFTMVTTFSLFSLLKSVDHALSGELPTSQHEQLVMIHQVSPVEVLPRKYIQDIQAVAGVELVTYTTWFGGFYQDLNNQGPMWAVEAEDYIDYYPELQFDKKQFSAWLAAPNGIAIGRKMAERFGLKLNDSFPLHSYIWETSDYSRIWEFQVSAIFDSSEPNADLDQLLIHYDFFDRARVIAKQSVGFFLIRGDDSVASDTLAEELDSLFVNSPAPTKTNTLHGFVKLFANQLGNIGQLINGVLGVTFVLTLLMLCSHFAHVSGQMNKEWAILQSLGFSKARLSLFVCLELCFLTMLGWYIGSSFGEEMITQLAPAVQDFIPGVKVTLGHWILSFAIAVLALIAAALVPLWRLWRLDLVTALRGES